MVVNKIELSSFSLEGRTAIITGGSGGIGTACALTFASHLDLFEQSVTANASSRNLAVGARKDFEFRLRFQPELSRETRNLTL